MNPAERNTQLFVYPIGLGELPFECHRTADPIRLGITCHKDIKRRFQPILAGDSIIIDVANIQCLRLLQTSVPCTREPGNRLI
ncbi:MAG: hypothetical protein ACD_75C00447G0001 [uncultured bacterium]|nr:MAG: hypothetical protein ACD_75C00447G0001 [uncultured bacterium]